VEGLNIARFDSELAPKGFIIFGGPPQTWDERIPWAKGRRREVMSRVASEVIRQEFPRYHAEFGDDDSTVSITK
jgi:hypothetical protein